MNTIDAIKKRRTIRRFKQQQISEVQIKELINAARLASCGGNMQRIHYLVVQSQNLVKKIFDETAWAGHVKPKRNPEWGKDAPLSFIVLVGPTNAGTVIHADAGAAIENMQICATEMELGCCWLGAFKKKAVSDLLSLPENIEPLYLLAVGYPDELPVQEDIDAGESSKYYLDERDCLHVPKFTVEVLTKWM